MGVTLIPCPNDMVACSTGPILSNLNNIPEEERGLFDLVGKHVIKHIEEFMPKINNL